MKNILFILSLLIILISCKHHAKKAAKINSVEQGSKVLHISPIPFIPLLPEKLKENSGIIYFDKLLWTINDSGGENKIYGFDFSGKIKKEIEIKGAKNIDWEDIAQDEKYIYISDFGNNYNSRKDLKVYQIKKKDIGKKSSQKVDSKEINFEYKNQTDFKPIPHSGSFDCEALVEFNDSLYIFTKSWKTRTTSVYKIPNRKGNYKTNPIDSLDVTGLITGADISPDKKKLALIGYKDYKPILWLCSGISSKNILGTSQTYIEMDSIFNAQTEGVCFISNDSLLISCESSSKFNQQVFLFNLKKLEKDGAHKNK
jgi:hypothetical protein